MKIRLSDISREGSIWNLTRGQEHDLDIALQDLLGSKEAYQVTLSIDPLDQAGTYNVSGKLKTQWVEECSRCADDFTFAIDHGFQDILIPKLEMPRNGSTVKPHITESASTAALEHSAYEYQDDKFDLGEFLHEIIALARPLAPSPAVDALTEKCMQCQRSPEEIRAKFESKAQESLIKPPSPFEVLKTLKN